MDRVALVAGIRKRVIELAVLMATKTRRNREVILGRLLTVKAPLEVYDRAVTSLLEAIRDRGLAVGSDPAAMLAEAVAIAAALEAEAVREADVVERARGGRS